MARGTKSKIGDTRTAPNGYHYTKTKSGWSLTHRLVIEKHLGRELEFDERVKFKDGDRTNFMDPSNLVVFKIKEPTIKGKLARLYVRRDEILDQIKTLESQLDEL